MTSTVAIDMNPVIYGSRAVYRCTRNIVNALETDGSIQYRYLYIDYRGQNEKYLAHSHEPHVIPIPFRALKPLWRVLHWPSIETFKIHCDLFYTNEVYFPPSKSSPIVSTIHGLAYKKIPDYLEPAAVKALSQGMDYLLKNSRYYIAVSQKTADEFMSLFGISSRNVFVITHGIDANFFPVTDKKSVQAELRSRFKITRRYILFVGAIGKPKNIPGILTAYQRIAEKSDHDLVLVGPPDNAWHEAIRYVKENRIENRVHFIGHIAKTSELNFLYNGASLFLFPSYYEGWTSPPLEAMASGTPVIVSNCSSLPETTEDAALKVDPDNPEEIAVTLSEVLRDDNLKNDLIQRGFMHVKKHTWPRSANKLKEVFIDVLSRRSTVA